MLETLIEEMMKVRFYLVEDWRGLVSLMRGALRTVS